MKREPLSFTKLCTTYVGRATNENKQDLLDFLISAELVEDKYTPTGKGICLGIENRMADDGKTYLVYGEDIQEMVEESFVFQESESVSFGQSSKSDKRHEDTVSLEQEIASVFEGCAPIKLPLIDYLEGLSDDQRREKLNSELKKCYGQDAEYRDGQYEAIEGVLRSKKTLVVQKTGWGKSLVYFMSTKMIRENSPSRITLIISPLLALMNNQIDSAKKLGLNVKTINSENVDDWKSIFSDIRDNKVDALIVSPERLANETFQDILVSSLIPRTGLFVVDEAHCISDWGHDFRPDYRRIINLIKKLPENVPVLATTATANDRVVNDIKAQIGEDMVISRGPLMRESIAIQTIHIESREERLSWLVGHINELPGSGVVYCLTVNDCQLVNDWLNKNGIKSAVFTGRTQQSVKEASITAFINNEIKAMVATTAFGMGYDKPDIGFVIHFQKPKDIISYYQQIGRAGRDLDKAYAICFYGDEDDIINEYFINNAFPTESDMEVVVEAVKKEPGLEANDLERLTNLTRTKIKGILGYLEIEGALTVNNKKWSLGYIPWTANIEKSKQITQMRYAELERMNEFVRTNDCYMEFLAKELDDFQACKCGKCSNCLNKDLIGGSVGDEARNNASDYINKQRFSIKIRKQWPNKGCSEDNKLNIAGKYRAKEGYVLSAYADSEVGQCILESIENNKPIDDEIVDKAISILKSYVEDNNIECLSYIPSWNHEDVVRDLAERLADKLGISIFESLEKIDEGEDQSTLENSYLQWENANTYYEVMDVQNKNTLLLDLTIRSGWTMTVCVYKLLKQGNGDIYPFVLLSTANQVEMLHDTFR